VKEISNLYNNPVTPEQLKNRKNMQERRELAAKRKVDTHRNIIIGELVCRYFPDVMEYQPQRSKSANTEVFRDFENFLKMLASDVELLAHIKGRAEPL
jgi:hypothetical protein